MARRSKGEGSLYQTKDKTWIYQYQVDGKRKTKRFPSKAAATAYKEAINAPVLTVTSGGNVNIIPRGENVTTVGGWLEKWLEIYAKPTIKLSTYCSYEQYIRGHIKPHIGGLYMNTLTLEDMQRFFNERAKTGNIKTGEGLSPKTLVNLRNMLHAAFDQAVLDHLLPENPVSRVRLPKTHKQEMRVLDKEEQNRLILAARQAPEPAAFGIIFDLFTGLRLGELCALRWQNVNMDARCFRVCGTRNRLPNFDPSVSTNTSVQTFDTPKTDNSRRIVYLIDGLYDDFMHYYKIQQSIAAQYPGYNPEGYVFCQESGQPYEPRTYQDLFKRCLRQAGIAEANFHSLRHTFATRSLEQGMDVVALARLLGHSSPSITLDKYGHALADHQRTSVQKLDGLYESAKAPQTVAQHTADWDMAPSW